MTSPMLGFCEHYRFEPDQDGTRVWMSADVEASSGFCHRSWPPGYGGRSGLITAA
jgi:hypothetical protein